MTKLAPKLKLSGLEKTAILMNVLGKDYSLTMMKDLQDGDVRRLLKIMGTMKRAPITLINDVLREFLFRISEKEEIIFDENLALPELITAALGEERAKAIFGALKAGNPLRRKQLQVLDSIEPKKLAEFLVAEHPQTIALVISHLDIEKQLGIVKLFPDALRAEIMLRMASLEYVAPHRVDELDEVLKKELSARTSEDHQVFGGVSLVAELINNLDRKSMNSLMVRIEEKDPILAEEIRQHMFTFSDIARIDEKGIQLILREVPNDKLLLSLKSATDELKDKIFGAMSERAAEMLREDLGALGPQKVSDVEGAQRAIVSVVKRLQEEGKVVIGVGEEAEVIP